MTLMHLTGAQGYIKLQGGAVWADATLNFTLNQASATAARGGKFSDLNLPGKRSCTITAKNIMRSGAMIGGMVTDTAVTGSATALQAAETWTAGTALTIGANPATPSRVKVTLSVAVISTGGTLVIYGTDIHDIPISEVLTIANASAIGSTWTTRNIFKTTTFALPVSVASTGGGKFAFDGVAASSSYTTTEAPKIYQLEFGGLDSVTGNTVYVVASNCFANKSALAYADANTVFMDDVGFTMQDIDADLAVYEVTTG